MRLAMDTSDPVADTLHEIEIAFGELEVWVDQLPLGAFDDVVRSMREEVAAFVVRQQAALARSTPATKPGLLHTQCDELRRLVKRYTSQMYIHTTLTISLTRRIA